jgi:hypothetical protein
MKRILVAVNIFLLTAIIILACDIDGDRSPDDTHVIVPDSTCYEIQNYSAIATTGLITANSARMMSLAYKEDVGKLMIHNGTVSTGMLDARSAWFNLNVFKKFIQMVEDTVCESGCKGLELGIRFYYAKYPSASGLISRDDLKSVRSDYANHHTLFMVPAYYDRARDKYIDFDPGKLKNGCTPAPFDYSDSTTTALIMMVPLNNSLTLDGSVQNHGGLAPPPDNGGTFGDFE